MPIHGSAIIQILLPLLAAFLIVGTCSPKPKLKFRPDGSFKVVQFTDIHYGTEIDPRTTAAMSWVLDSETPDFVVISGDSVLSYHCQSPDYIERVVDIVAQPIEDRLTPWAITFGNHDADYLGQAGINSEEMLRMYMKYPHNLNAQSPPDVFGAGNANLLISGRASDEPAYGIWLLDSNSEAPLTINDQKLGGYDWIHFSQVKWYWDTSVALEKQYGRKIDSLMFFHTPLPEHKDLMNAAAFTGEINEGCCAPLVNSGLFVAALERGDVKGIFVGHDHINTLVGDWYGITLGYGGSIGYDAYGIDSKDDAEANRLRGARVFTIKESDPSRFETKYVTANSLT